MGSGIEQFDTRKRHLTPEEANESKKTKMASGDHQNQDGGREQAGVMADVTSDILPILGLIHRADAGHELQIKDWLLWRTIWGKCRRLL